jgi:hypothetical protein
MSIITAEEYNDAPGLRQSEIPSLLKGTKALHAYRSQPREATPQMILGTAVHWEILGGNSVVIYPGESRRGNDWKEFKAAHAGQDILLEGEMSEAREMALAFLTHPLAKSIMASKPRTELPLVWKMANQQGELIDCKGKIDLYWADECMEIDIKTAANIDERSMANWLHDKYAVQRAFYKAGLEQNGFRVQTSALACIETDAAAGYRCRFYIVDPQDVDYGMAQVMEALNLYPEYERQKVAGAFSVPFPTWKVLSRTRWQREQE